MGGQCHPSAGGPWLDNKVKWKGHGKQVSKQVPPWPLLLILTLDSCAAEAPALARRGKTEAEDEIDPFISKLFLIVVFITATESKSILSG